MMWIFTQKMLGAQEAAISFQRLAYPVSRGSPEPPAVLKVLLLSKAGEHSENDFGGPVCRVLYGSR